MTGRLRRDGSPHPGPKDERAAITRAEGDRPMSEDVDALRAFLDTRLGDRRDIEVDPMPGGGSCEIFEVRRGQERLVLRRAPRFASSSTAHDVLREFRILDAIKDEPVAIARPLLSCADPEVFGAPFYLMAHVDGVPIRAGLPAAWAEAPSTHGAAFEQLVDGLLDVHALDRRGPGLGDLGHPERYLERQVQRWLAQLGSYGGRDLPLADELGRW